MSIDGDVAGQIVSTATNVAAKGTEFLIEKCVIPLAELLAAVIRNEKRRSGKVSIKNFPSAKDARTFVVKNKDLAKFGAMAKQYGIKFAIVTGDKGAKKDPESIVDIIIDPADAARANRILEKLGVDYGDIDRVAEPAKDAVFRTLPAPAPDGTYHADPELVKVIYGKGRERELENPTMAKTESYQQKKTPSEPELNASEQSGPKAPADAPYIRAFADEPDEERESIRKKIQRNREKLDESGRSEKDVRKQDRSGKDHGNGQDSSRKQTKWRAGNKNHKKKTKVR